MGIPEACHIQQLNILGQCCRATFHSCSQFKNNNKLVCRHYLHVSVGGHTRSVDHRHVFQGHILLSLAAPEPVKIRLFLAWSAVRSVLPYAAVQTLLLHFEALLLPAQSLKLN